MVQADGGYGDITAFRTGLEERELEYVVQVKGVTSAQPADAVPVAPEYQGRGRPPVPRYPDKSVSLRDLVLAAGREQVRTVGWREGDRRPAGKPVHRTAGTAGQRRPTRRRRDPSGAMAVGRVACR